MLSKENNWNNWFTKFVQPVFINEQRSHYYELLNDLKPPFYPKYWIAEKFYRKIENDNRFDDELKLFFSFLYSCGFFMDNIISFEEWIKMKNWQRPWQTEIISDEKTILEILDSPNGTNNLKKLLIQLPYLSQ